MRLYLVQHGEAKSEVEDPERPLTDRGAKTVVQVARWVSDRGLGVGEIRHSGKRRAAETAEILAQHVKPPKGVRAAAGLGPRDNVLLMAAALEHEPESLMLVGHLPFLGRLAGQLVVADAGASVVRFTNAGIVCLWRDQNGWGIDWALPPRLLA